MQWCPIRHEVQAKSLFNTSAGFRKLIFLSLSLSYLSDFLFKPPKFLVIVSPMSAFSIIISVLPVLVLAQNDTSDNQDTERVGWVSSPNVRSTSNILWSCFTIFLVCSWKSVHLNLPSDEESEAGWHTLGGCLPYWPTWPVLKLLFRKVKWMCVIAIAPELGVAMAADEFFKARNLQMEIRSPNFTLTHAFYALMGGFVIAIPRFQIEDQDKLAEQSRSLSTLSIKNLDIYCLRRNHMGRLFHQCLDITTRAASDSETLDILQELNPFLPLVEEESGQRWFPTVTEEDIDNQSKSDSFTKAFAVLQCAWLIIQCIARASEDLRLTELELTTLAFIMCAFVMYGFWWCKPFDAQRPTLLLCLDQGKATRLKKWLRRRTRKTRRINLTIDQFLHFLGDRPYQGSEEVLGTIIFNATAVAFSSLHLVAWNWDFPSQPTRLLWRILSLVTTCAPLMVLLTALSGRLVRWGKVLPRWLLSFGATVLFFLPGVMYVIARLGLIFLVFYCFSSMPASVYKAVDWNVVLPHFS